MKKILLAVLSLSAIHAAFAQDPDAGAGRYNFNGQNFKLDPLFQIENNDLDKGKNEVIDTSKFPRVVDLIPFQSAIKNQGDRGSCAFFTSNALVESLIKQKQKVEVNLSEEYLVWKVKADLKLHSNVDGSLANENMQGIVKGGIVLERDLPFQPSYFTAGLPCGKYKEGDASTPTTCFSHNKPTKEVLAKVIPSTGFVPEVYDTDSAKVAQLMALKKQPVIVGVMVNPNGWDSKTGVAVHNEALQRECDITPGLCGGHSIMLVGYDLTKKTFTFKNSWGTDWGNKGYGTLAFSYLDKYGRGSMVSGHLTANLSIPADYAVVPQRSSVTKSSLVEIKKTTTGENVSTSLTTSVKNLTNSVYYVSAYIATAKDGSAISDANAELMPVLPEYQKANGKIAKSTAYKVFAADGVSSAVSVTNMNISEAILNKAQLSGGKDAYVRLSTYVYGDNGWVQLSREYKKINPGL